MSLERGLTLALLEMAPQDIAEHLTRAASRPSISGTCTARSTDEIGRAPPAYRASSMLSPVVVADVHTSLSGISTGGMNSGRRTLDATSFALPPSPFANSGPPADASPPCHAAAFSPSRRPADTMLMHAHSADAAALSPSATLCDPPVDPFPMSPLPMGLLNPALVATPSLCNSLSHYQTRLAAMPECEEEGEKGDSETNNVQASGSHGAAAAAVVDGLMLCAAGGSSQCLDKLNSGVLMPTSFEEDSICLGASACSGYSGTLFGLPPTSAPPSRFSVDGRAPHRNASVPQQLQHAASSSLRTSLAAVSAHRLMASMAVQDAAALRSMAAGAKQPQQHASGCSTPNSCIAPGAPRSPANVTGLSPAGSWHRAVLGATPLRASNSIGSGMTAGGAESESRGRTRCGSMPHPLSRGCSAKAGGMTASAAPEPLLLSGLDDTCEHGTGGCSYNDVDLDLHPSDERSSAVARALLRHEMKIDEPRSYDDPAAGPAPDLRGWGRRASAAGASPNPVSAAATHSLPLQLLRAYGSAHPALSADASLILNGDGAACGAAGGGRRQPACSQSGSLSALHIPSTPNPGSISRRESALLAGLLSPQPCLSNALQAAAAAERPSGRMRSCGGMLQDGSGSSGAAAAAAARGLQGHHSQGPTGLARRVVGSGACLASPAKPGKAFSHWW